MVRRTGPAVRTVRVWSEEAAVGRHGGRRSVTWRRSPGPHAQPGPLHSRHWTASPSTPPAPSQSLLLTVEGWDRKVFGQQSGSKDHSQEVFRRSRRTTQSRLLVLQKTEEQEGWFVPGTHGQRMVGPGPGLCVADRLQRKTRTISAEVISCLFPDHQDGDPAP